MSKYIVSKVLYDILIEEGRLDEYMRYIEPNNAESIKSLQHCQVGSYFSWCAYRNMIKTRMAYFYKIFDSRLHNSICRNKIIRKDQVTFKDMPGGSLTIYSDKYFLIGNGSNTLAILVDNRLLLTEYQAKAIFHNFNDNVLNDILNNKNRTISPYFNKVFSKESLNNIKEAHAEQITSEN